MIDLTKILSALLSLIATIITCFLIPYIKARTTREQQEKILAYVKSGVFAAEQLYGAGHGSDKLEFVRNYLLGKGYEVDTVLIEAAVGEYINSTLNMLESSIHRDEEMEPPENKVDSTAD